MDWQTIGVSVGFGALIFFGFWRVIERIDRVKDDLTHRIDAVKDDLTHRIDAVKDDLSHLQAEVGFIKGHLSNRPRAGEQAE